MILSILGGFVLVRLLSWLMLAVWRRESHGLSSVTALHAITFGMLVLLQIAVRAPMGAFALAQSVVFLPGSLLWLAFDFAILVNNKKPGTGS